jgi:hypothetical protein
MCKNCGDNYRGHSSPHHHPLHEDHHQQQQQQQVTDHHVKLQPKQQLQQATTVYTDLASHDHFHHITTKPHDTAERLSLQVPIILPGTTTSTAIGSLSSSSHEHHHVSKNISSHSYTRSYVGKRKYMLSPAHQQPTSTTRHPPHQHSMYLFNTPAAQTLPTMTTTRQSPNNLRPPSWSSCRPTTTTTSSSSSSSSLPPLPATFLKSTNTNLNRANAHSPLYPLERSLASDASLQKICTSLVSAACLDHHSTHVNAARIGTCQMPLPTSNVRVTSNSTATTTLTSLSIAQSENTSNAAPPAVTSATETANIARHAPLTSSSTAAENLQQDHAMIKSVVSPATGACLDPLHCTEDMKTMETLMNTMPNYARKDKDKDDAYDDGDDNDMDGVVEQEREKAVLQEFSVWLRNIATASVNHIVHP